MKKFQENFGAFDQFFAQPDLNFDFRVLAAFLKMWAYYCEPCSVCKAAYKRGIRSQIQAFKAI